MHKMRVELHVAALSLWLCCTEPNKALWTSRGQSGTRKAKSRLQRRSVAGADHIFGDALQAAPFWLRTYYLSQLCMLCDAHWCATVITGWLWPKLPLWHFFSVTSRRHLRIGFNRGTRKWYQLWWGRVELHLTQVTLGLITPVQMSTSSVGTAPVYNGIAVADRKSRGAINNTIYWLEMELSKFSQWLIVHTAATLKTD